MRTNSIKIISREKLKNCSFDYDLSWGFAWINLSENITFQCCLDVDPVNRKSNGDCIFLKQITRNDCGADWGQCDDTNRKARTLFYYDDLLDALIDKAKDNGFTIL